MNVYPGPPSPVPGVPWPAPDGDEDDEEAA